RRALVRSSDGTDKSTLSRATSGENPFHLMPWLRVLSKELMRSASSRALISSYFFLCSGESSSYVTAWERVLDLELQSLLQWTLLPRSVPPGVPECVVGRNPPVSS